ncbi:tyrosine kinase receptor Cad96Ca-like [Lingula anatina]|uniref:Tyrosine kinase receptor Cad96Ca-like n=1 Tax=Lingula anatina TaxID=7574 RepID=A0A1S3JTC4_LINAN|nr:tyrosine kinase receptor Cad96Ca-like [Lingula anatina]|eukprot:XP_013413615.1 tyrosine kinase receptor Cad96Ca-like [Lingula anatina]
MEDKAVYKCAFGLLGGHLFKAPDVTEVFVVTTTKGASKKETASPSTAGFSKETIIAVGAGGGGGVLLVTIIVAVVCVKKKGKGNSTSDIYEMRYRKSNQHAHSGLTSDVFIDNIDDISLIQSIGQGHFGKVWKAEDKRPDAVSRILAVKVLKESATEVDQKDFIQEMDTMTSLVPHENVVKLLGYSKTVPAFIALEFMAYGSLKTFLHSSRSDNIYGNLHGGSNRLTSRDLLTFAEHVARGMSHVAKNGVGKRHADLCL